MWLSLTTVALGKFEKSEKSALQVRALQLNSNVWIPATPRRTRRIALATRLASAPPLLCGGQGERKREGQTSSRSAPTCYAHRKTQGADIFEVCPNKYVNVCPDNYFDVCSN